MKRRLAKKCFFASQGCKGKPVSKRRYCYHYTEMYGPNTLFVDLFCGSWRSVCQKHADEKSADCED